MYKFKIFLLSAVTVFAFSILQANSHQNNLLFTSSIHNPASPKVNWKKDVHDFGEIVQGKPVTVEFSFTNKGDAPLIINDVVSVCGCTVPDFPKEPIAPGKTSKITVTFNAANKGAFSKNITVKSNDEESVKILTIKGTVK